MPCQLIVVVPARGLRAPQPTQPQGLSLDIDRGFQHQALTTFTNGVAEEQYLSCDHPWHFECGQPLTSSLSTHLVPFPTRHPRGFVPTVPSLATWHLTTTVVVGHQLVAQAQGKGLGAKISHCHWGGPKDEHDQYRSWAAAREVSKGRTKRLLHAGVLVRPLAQMLGAGHTHTCKCRGTLVLPFVHCSRPKHNEADWIV